MRKTKIIVSPYSGFCFGVRRALEIAEKALRGKKKVYSLGPIIHNPQVVSEFKKKGLAIIDGLRAIDFKNTRVLIPSHGTSPKILKDKRASYVDTTCPLVARVQNIVRGLRERGYFIVIVGDKKHPEVKGLSGMAGRNSCVLKDRNEARKIGFTAKKIAVISQTTASVSNFRDILSEITKKEFDELLSINTVCKNTIDRQKKAQAIARKVDAMFIIGGKQSANTTKLAGICKKVNSRTYHIESGRDLKGKMLRNARKIGIATGASTPPYAIREFTAKVKKLSKR